MSKATIASNSPFTCTATVPDPLVPIAETLSRWSNSNVERPALDVIPENEKDVVQALQHARENGLTVVVSGGGNAAFVPITKNTLYLRMEKFDLLELDEVNKTVTIGGGVRIGRVLTFLAEKGFYTVLPSSNAVGMAGFVFGGGGVSNSSI
jgi:FAD/FMN-containing dehydrogenase